mmetsp:Transcript_103608/g.179952  ORF Transcript_103608/g.179952 Transcript_103608/m.179952 type:complete len:228 (+) Transcript_103608:381-1064(+)
MPTTIVLLRSTVSMLTLGSMAMATSSFQAFSRLLRVKLHRRQHSPQPRPQLRLVAGHRLPSRVLPLHGWLMVAGHHLCLQVLNLPPQVDIIHRRCQGAGHSRRWVLGVGHCRQFKEAGHSPRWLPGVGHSSQRLVKFTPKAYQVHQCIRLAPRINHSSTHSAQDIKECQVSPSTRLISHSTKARPTHGINQPRVAISLQAYRHPTRRSIEGFGCDGHLDGISACPSL